MKIQDDKISAVIKEIGLPDTAKFCGYVIHLPNEDEFVADIIETQASVVRKFCNLPELAKRYQDTKKALKDAKHCKQETMICFLFDSGAQYFVTEIDN